MPQFRSGPQGEVQRQAAEWAYQAAASELGEMNLPIGGSAMMLYYPFCFYHSELQGDALKCKLTPNGLNCRWQEFMGLKRLENEGVNEHHGGGVRDEPDAPVAGPSGMNRRPTEGRDEPDAPVAGPSGMNRRPTGVKMTTRFMEGDLELGRLERPVSRGSDMSLLDSVPSRNSRHDSGDEGSSKLSIGYQSRSRSRTRSRSPSSTGSEWNDNKKVDVLINEAGKLMTKIQACVDELRVVRAGKGQGQGTDEVIVDRLVGIAKPAQRPADTEILEITLSPSERLSPSDRD